MPQRDAEPVSRKDKLPLEPMRLEREGAIATLRLNDRGEFGTDDTLLCSALRRAGDEAFLAK
ncbi:MAG: hypothetical protein NT123_04820 [Proteobacteria bacterium]|nr:hypothetical protein [Pseudomonadota bacterium]